MIHNYTEMNKMIPIQKITLTNTMMKMIIKEGVKEEKRSENKGKRNWIR